MTVSAAHRLLAQRTPSTVDKRLWVMTGQVQDWFLYSRYEGVVSLRCSLELWAREHGMAITETPIHSTEEVRVRWDGERVVPASDSEANATVTTGPASLGSFTRCALDATEIPVGSSAAPIVAAGLRYADELWGLGIGELIPATDLDRS